MTAYLSDTRRTENSSPHTRLRRSEGTKGRARSTSKTIRCCVSRRRPLMGSNFSDYIREAHRALKLDGLLLIWEARSGLRIRRIETRLGHVGGTWAASETSCVLPSPHGPTSTAGR